MAPIQYITCFSPSMLTEILFLSKHQLIDYRSKCVAVETVAVMVSLDPQMSIWNSYITVFISQRSVKGKK